jgi:hypothetical protein
VSSTLGTIFFVTVQCLVRFLTWSSTVDCPPVVDGRMFTEVVIVSPGMTLAVRLTGSDGTSSYHA